MTTSEKVVVMVWLFVALLVLSMAYYWLRGFWFLCLLMTPTLSLLLLAIGGGAQDPTAVTCAILVGPLAAWAPWIVRMVLQKQFAPAPTPTQQSLRLYFKG